MSKYKKRTSKGIYFKAPNQIPQLSEVQKTLIGLNKAEANLKGMLKKIDRSIAENGEELDFEEMINGVNNIRKDIITLTGDDTPPPDTDDPHKPGKGCHCARCEMGEEAYQAHIKKCLDTYGWYAHFITDVDKETATGHNCHTHGLVQNFNHLDLQITFPIPGEIAHALFNRAIEQIRNGVIFLANDITQYGGIMEGDYKVKFIARTESGRPVYRMILPNANHQYMGGDYTKQYLF